MLNGDGIRTRKTALEMTIQPEVAMKIERTFVMIKPDGVQRGLVGEVLGRFEKRGMKIVAMKLITISRELAEKHYAEHVGKDFYPPLLKYITEGPVVVTVIEGLDAIQQIRKMVGATQPYEAAVGTIRGDFAQDLPMNIIHASDSPESADREIGLYFNENEIHNYDLDSHKWVFSPFEE